MGDHLLFDSDVTNSYRINKKYDDEIHAPSLIIYSSKLWSSTVCLKKVILMVIWQRYKHNDVSFAGKQRYLRITLEKGM